MSDCKITCLPEEVIAIILSYNVITMEDIINFRRVCKQFRYAAKHDKLFLEKKLSQRWPYAKKKYEDFKKTMDKEVNFVTKGINSVIQFRNYLSQIFFHDYYYNNRSNENYFDDSIDKILKFDDAIKFSGNVDEYVKRLDEKQLLPKRHRHIIELKYIFYIDEIKYLLTQSPQIDRKSIERYCNIERSHYMKLFSIGNELDRYTEKPEREQLLEETCIFIAQRIQPRKDVCYTNVSASLDTIAQEVLNCLRVKHPNHSIFSTSHETFSYWKANNIEDNYWDKTESTQIMDTLQQYIFGTLNFRARISFIKHRTWLSDDYTIYYPCGYFNFLSIDYVLRNKNGQDFIVYTIFHSVARRLGVRCDILDGLVRFCIFWKPKFIMNNLKNARCFFIKNETFPNCLSNSLLYYQLCKARQIRVIAITTEKMLVLTKNMVREFITAHKIKDLRLFQVNCNV